MKMNAILSMLILVLMSLPIVAVAENASRTQTGPVADYHHVHLRAVDTAEVAGWYADNMKGERTRVGPFEAVSFGGTQLLFYPAGQPGADGRPGPGELKSSAGSGIDHLGFSFPDLDAGLKTMEANGAKILSEPREIQGLFKYAFIEDPWGQKVEVMEDPELAGFHHVHLVSPDPDRAIGWFQKYFGGEISRFKGLPPLPSIRYDDMWLIVTPAKAGVSPSMFRMIDHLGWAVIAMDEQMERVKSDNVRVVRDKFLFGGIRNIAFIESPGGVLIEILEAAEE